MAAAAEAMPAGGAPKGKKKLIVIIAAVLVLALAGGGAAVFMMKKKAADAAAAEDGEGGGSSHAAARKHDPKAAPIFVPLDPFIVNLADKETERYAQIGITLEIDDAHFADELKAYMPAIRNGILLTLASKTSAQLLDRAGKEALAQEIMRETVRPLGIELDDPEVDEASAPKAEGEKPKKKKKRRKAADESPVRQVHFSSFIIQ